MLKLANQICVVNNYPGTGIGDFGIELVQALRSRGLLPSYLETDPEGLGYLHCIRTLALFDGLIIANIGLTSWGRSGWRNLLGFLTLGLRGAFHRPAVVLLHNMMEIIDVRDSGYRVDRITRFGAVLAISFLAKCRVAVFSERLSTILEQQYGICPVLVSPIPCSPEERVQGERQPFATVVTAGYIAPYKGIELLASTARASRHAARWVMVGGVHRILASDPVFSKEVKRLIALCRAAGIEVLGRLPDEDFRRTLSSATVGILCYTSASGASASFAAMASAGLPVVSTDVPELREVAELGAGIVLAPANPQDLARAVDELCTNPSRREELASMQRRYAKEHSWKVFLNALTIPLGLPQDL